MFRSTEQGRFAAIVADHMRAGTGPLLLEGGTGLGKTRAYLHALISSNRRVAIVLPSHQLIDQLLASSDLASMKGTCSVEAFRPRGRMDDAAAYEAQRQACLAAQVLICTSASVIIDQRLKGAYNGVTQRDYILFDEADQLPECAALQSDFYLPKECLTAYRTLPSLKAQLQAFADKPKRTVPAEQRAAARAMLEILEQPECTFAWVSPNSLGDIELTHALPGRLLKKIANQANVAFVSATLSINGKFKDFTHLMGIGAGGVDPRSTIIEPVKHGTLTFLQEALEVDSPAWLAACVSAVSSAERPVLVVTPSHALAQQLGALLLDAVVRSETETTAEAAERVRVSADGVLIAAGAWAGLDTALRWRTIVVPRVPYPVPKKDGSADAERALCAAKWTYLDNCNTAIRRLRQVIGRGLRTPDAECTVIILDKRATQLTGFIPERFERAWEDRLYLEGGRRQVVRCEAERSPDLRKRVLAEYGHRCMNPNCPSRVEHVLQLHVHHRHAIAEGIRLTSLADAMVLCANCHALAHIRNPPYQLDIESIPAELLPALAA